ncbi:MAG: homocysteine S-methyltransferase family protein [Planctomycetota bacterium]|nr:MAG: homocysteine S-methyltransferase family protein [Planctomycetota bacterium]
MKAKIEDYAGKVTVADGAWGTQLQKLGCPTGSCLEELNVSNPDLVEQVARSYVEAGAQIILTNTFQGNRIILAKHGSEGKVSQFNRAGAEISKRAAGDRARVFGTMGPSGKMVMSGEATEEELFEVFTEQAEAIAEGGADGLVAETMSELVEARAAVRAGKTTGLLVVGCMTYDSGSDQTLTMMGVTPEQAAEELTAAGADMIGCNCGIGIDNYIKVAGKLRAVSDRPIWVKANAGMPEVVGDEIVYHMTPAEFADKVQELIAAGANVVGGCCGTSPEFIRAICDSLNAEEQKDNKSKH